MLKEDSEPASEEDLKEGHTMMSEKPTDFFNQLQVDTLLNLKKAEEGYSQSKDHFFQMSMNRKLFKSYILFS